MGEVESKSTQFPQLAVQLWFYSGTLNNIIVFGGFGHVDTPGASNRLNDLWTFDVKSESWSKPQLSFLGASVDLCPPWTSSLAAMESPSPRGAHASDLVLSGSWSFLVVVEAKEVTLDVIFPTCMFSTFLLVSGTM
jgi:hypothetical protein